MLSVEKFRLLVESAPLVAVDFIIEDSSGNILLGERLGAPAKGLWCVPGGRIYKDEKLCDGVKRKLCEEIGLHEVPPMRFLGVYEHFYSDSAMDTEVSTHYIVLAFTFKIKEAHRISGDSQHEKFEFMPRSDVLKSNQVPVQIKNFLRGNFEDYLNLNLI